MPTELNDKFIDFLSNSGDALRKFLDVVVEFYKMQSDVPSPGAPAAGPREWKAGEDVALKTIGISTADLDAIEKEYAEATVKHLAIEYVKGFITGVMLRGI